MTRESESREANVVDAKFVAGAVDAESLPAPDIGRGCVRGPLERRQVEPAERDDATACACSHQSYPGLHPAAQRIRGALRRRTGAALRRFAGLRAGRGASKTERKEWQGMIEGYPAAACGAARGRDPARRTARRRGRGASNSSSSWASQASERTGPDRSWSRPKWTRWAQRAASLRSRKWVAGGSSEDG